MRINLSRLTIAVAVFALAACKKEPEETTPPAPVEENPAPPVEAAPEPAPEPEKPAEPPPPPAPTKDIVDLATEAGTFTTLLKAIDTAGLKDTLKGPGPFTVFAPTDEAFNKLPKGELDKLLKNKKKLEELLKYHVVEGAVKAADVSAKPSATTLAGKDITIDATAGVKLNGAATVVTPDIQATNGVIHTIDTVLTVPKAGAKPKAKAE
jgi:uncharacterized surface protein with fasciclin (FAS1) repeats